MILLISISNAGMLSLNFCTHNKKIIEKLKLISDSKSAADLARKLGTERQNLKSYEIKSSTDLNNRIISLLIDKIVQD